MSLTVGERLQAQRLQTQDMSHKAIGKKIGRTSEEVRLAIGRGGKRTKPLKYTFHTGVDLTGPSGIVAAGIPMDRTVPPADVLAERARALSQPRTITAAVFGDPPPGRSALDKRQGA